MTGNINFVNESLRIVLFIFRAVFLHVPVLCFGTDWIYYLICLFHRGQLIHCLS